MAVNPEVKRALVTGVTGQDGAYLSKFLLQKGYEVYGGYRRISSPNFWRLQSLGILDKVKLLPIDLIDANSIYEAIKMTKPHEIYHLGAQSFVGASFEQPSATAQITGVATAHFLEAIRLFDKSIKFYQASTSELYGDGASSALNEDSPFRPSSPYSAAKLYAYWMTKIYRQAYGIFAVNGILFNHESPLRGLEFVTRKVTNAVARIKLGLQTELTLGNLDAKRDWGFAGEYVESMWLMLQQPEADDYVVATGETHTVREFVVAAFTEAGLDWEKYVQSDSKLLRAVDVGFLLGDARKAKEKLGWEAKVKFNDLVKIMVDEDIARWTRWTSGDHFPFDAPYYPGDNYLRTRALQ